jgi:hypothetical protein
MALDYLHNHPNFSELIQIVAQEHSIAPSLVEKDYWIMHCLYGLQQLGMSFFMKGGTSLSKGYKIIEGINQVNRDTNFDDEKKYRSGGIRLFYKSKNSPLKGVKEGILLEVGFDDITPNEPLDISSWAYDFAIGKVDIVDNRAKRVLCYHPGYTFVEKLQAISTKFRKQQATGTFSENFMRHYYDVYCLLKDPDILKFIGTPEYHTHKEKRFKKNPYDISSNEAFLLANAETRDQYARQYKARESLYYRNKPEFEEILALIKSNITKL